MSRILPIITSAQAFTERLTARRQSMAGGVPVVTDILTRVRAAGDAALRDLTLEYDGVQLDQIRVPQQVIDAAIQSLPPKLIEAAKVATGNVRRFHAAQKPLPVSMKQPDGCRVEWRYRALRRVGLYVPGGRYPLLSTLIMTAVPAQVAGVAEIAVCSPPTESGYPAVEIMGLGGLLGITEMYAIGGAQAIAALAYGTQSIPCVDKIVGPGNMYVTAAKEQVASVVGIDMAAGPTEVVVLADESARADWVAADLISQAEHDPEAWPVLITTSTRLASDVVDAVTLQLDQLPDATVARAALSKAGFIYVCSNTATAIDAVNEIAPEHLCLQLKDAAELVDQVIAGAIFVGGFSPVALGDYWAGPNHTLPTGGQARFTGPLALADFLVPYSVIEADAGSLARSQEALCSLAYAEGLAGHARSVEIRAEGAN